MFAAVPSGGLVQNVQAISQYPNKCVCASIDLNLHISDYPPNTCAYKCVPVFFTNTML